MKGVIGQLRVALNQKKWDSREDERGKREG